MKTKQPDHWPGGALSCGIPIFNAKNVREVERRNAEAARKCACVYAMKTQALESVE